MSVFLKAEHISKSFGECKALDNISFELKKGDVLGFLGPNGAGKTTTMRILVGFLEADQGNVQVCGHDIIKEPLQAKAHIGYLPEGAPLYYDMTPLDYLNFMGKMRGLDDAALQQNCNEIIDRVHISQVLHQKIDTLSKGYKRRVALGQALLGSPDVLILDEPTDGLDPNQKHEVRKLIQEMAQDKAIIISTHILEEVTAMCNRTILIHEGKIKADFTPQDMLTQSRFHNTISLVFSDEMKEKWFLNIMDSLNGIKDVDHVWRDENQTIRKIYIKPVKDKNILSDIVKLTLEEKWLIEDIRVEQGSLDEVFRNMTQ